MKKVSIAALAILASAVFVRAEEQAQDQAAPLSLEQRLGILERKFEIDQEAAAAKAKNGSGVTTGKDGFAIKSNDGNFTLKLSGVLQVDYRDYLGDHGSTQFTDSFLIRRARPTFEGTWAKNVAFRITPEFGSNGAASPSSSLIDAYIELQYINAAKLRFGKIKPPIGLENIQSDPVMFFNERSLVTQLVPIRDTGVQLSGEFGNGQLAYQAAIVNGVADGVTGETETNDGKEYEGRLFIQPFKPASSEWINGLGFGVGAGIGDVFGSVAGTTSNLSSGYKTDGQQNFFTYATGNVASGQRRRISPQGYWYFTHVGLLGEYIASSQDIVNSTTPARSSNITNRAWQIAGSIVLTGERPSFNGIKPRKPFDPKNHTWGAFEVVGRYAVFKADEDAYTQGFALASASARKAKAWATGLNWYLNNNLRINTDYAVTSFLGGAAGGRNRPTEEVVFSRVQITY